MTHRLRWSVALLLGLATPAAAQDYQRRIDEYSAAAEGLAKADAKGHVTLELGTLREWIGEARAYLRDEEEEAVVQTLDRVRVQARLVDALLRRARSEAQARAAHEAADSKENEGAKLRNQAQALEQKLAVLEGKAKQAGGGPQ